MPYIVQFPHPGPEHQPKGKVQPWNTGDHRRKFLISNGSYLDAAGKQHEGELTFWGEWEPPSQVVQQWQPNGQLPCYLHEPFWCQPKTNSARQNTDPWVFGDQFLYSNCRQPRQSKLRELAAGSVILFGSRLSGNFVLDTVFVVASGERYGLGQTSAINVDGAFRVSTFESLEISPPKTGVLKLYRGATVANPVEGMYSFVPAKAADGGPVRFARPALSGGFINPNLAQAAACQSVSLAQAQAVWNQVRDQVLAAGCELGLRFDTPPLRAC